MKFGVFVLNAVIRRKALYNYNLVTFRILAQVAITSHNIKQRTVYFELHVLCLSLWTNKFITNSMHDN